MRDKDGHEVVRRWAHHPRCVALARAELLKALAEWGLSEIEYSAATVVSELVTNAVLHARAPRGREIETRFSCRGSVLRIEVHDAADERPEKRRPDANAEHGRGLLLVTAMADRWGVYERVGVGKAVWAEISAPEGC